MNRSVLEKLAKLNNRVELAEVKVDLALVDDIDKMLSTVKAERDANEKLANSVEGLDKRVQAAGADFAKKQKELDDMKSTLGKTLGKEIITLQTNGDKQYAKSEKLEKSAFALIQKAEKAAEALGVAPSSIKNFNELINVADDLEGWKLQIKSNIEKMKFPEFLQF